MHEVRERCVWTQQIDHRALVPYLVEESAELIDAVEVGSRDELREELGDLLWQVLFHAEIASRDPDDPFDIDDVARGLTEKMVRRHPHVFARRGRRDARAGARASGTPRRPPRSTQRTSVLDGVSRAMPSLALAQKLVGKAGQRRRGCRRPAAAPRTEAELGEALLALVAATARANGWDAERALRGAPARARRVARSEDAERRR